MSGFERLPTPMESLLLGLCLLTSAEEILSHQNGVRVVVEEGSDAVLPCSPINKVDLTGKLFDWRKDGQEVFMYDSGIHYNNGRHGQDQQFKGRVSHFQNQLMNGNASIKIQNTKMADSGSYRCLFPRLQPSQTFYIQLVVERILRDRSGETPGASKPIIIRLNETTGWLLLQCEVRGASPEPKVEWQDSAGIILPAEEPQVSERGGRYYVTLNITVNKTGHYRCVVTQEELSHQTSAETFVFVSVNPSSVSGKPCEDCSTKEIIGWLAGIVLGAVVVAAVLAGLKAKNWITFACNRGAAKDPTSSSTDPTNGIPLLEGVKGDHQHLNGSSITPAETPLT